MISKTELSSLTRREPRFNDIMSGIKASKYFSKELIDEIQEVIAIARKFDDEVVRPVMLEVDYKTHQQPDYLPHELVKEANR